jgi:hypothetical protein
MAGPSLWGLLQVAPITASSVGDKKAPTAILDHSPEAPTSSIKPMGFPARVKPAICRSRAKSKAKERNPSREFSVKSRRTTGFSPELLVSYSTCWGGQAECSGRRSSCPKAGQHPGPAAYNYMHRSSGGCTRRTVPSRSAAVQRCSNPQMMPSPTSKTAPSSLALGSACVV